MREPLGLRERPGLWQDLAHALDFSMASPAARARARRALHAGMALLCAALIHLAVVETNLAATRASLAALEDQARTLQRALAQRAEPVSPVPRDALKWRSLLGAIERAVDDSVAMTHLRGDVEGAAFQVELQARTRQDVVRFVERLAPQPGIRSLRIRLLDERTDTSHDRVHASLVGEWG